MIPVEREDMPVETETAYCARHPNIETAVRCASCGKPICTKCMVAAPVGIKCPDCARGMSSVMYKVRPERLLLAAIVSVIAGVGAGVIGKLFILAIFVGTAYGYFVGSVILKASGMKRGMKMEIVAGAGMVSGGLALKFAPLVALSFASPETLPAGAWVTGTLDPFFWVALALATAAAVSKIRYL